LSSSRGNPAPEGRRLDRWLWFARLAKSRSLAARLCQAGAVIVNGEAVRKANQMLRIGDTVAAPQGGLRRTVRVLAYGSRRGPAAEARLLYEETDEPAWLGDPMPQWERLLADHED
jgi:ribosome-associated heat shock protein Hsp15